MSPTESCDCGCPALQVMVFFSSCNSVKYHAELLNYIDIPVKDIHGKQKQQRRTTTFMDFCKVPGSPLTHAEAHVKEAVPAAPEHADLELECMTMEAKVLYAASTSTKGALCSIPHMATRCSHPTARVAAGAR